MSSGPASQRMGIQADEAAISVSPPHGWSTGPSVGWSTGFAAALSASAPAAKTVEAARPLLAQSLEVENDFLDGSADHLDLAQIAGPDAELFGQAEFVVAPVKR